MPNVDIEELGKSQVNGIEAAGERITRTIAEGSEGNDRAFDIVQERWHAADLDVDVLVKQSDPRRGTWTTNLTEVNPGEPDPKFFEIPEGYKVREMRGALNGMAPAEDGNGPHYPNGILGSIVPPNR